MRNHLQQLQRRPVALVRTTLKTGARVALRSPVQRHTCLHRSASCRASLCATFSPPGYRDTGLARSPATAALRPSRRPSPASLAPQAASGRCVPGSRRARFLRSAERSGCLEQGAAEGSAGIQEIQKRQQSRERGPLTWCSTRNSEKRITVRPGGVRGRDTFIQKNCKDSQNL